jgi:2,5-diketo-D-gluconate reductase A
MDQPSLTLPGDVAIPQLGLGVYKVAPEEARETVLSALDLGYRHIDTAQMYRNEAGVGEALAESGLRRDEVFVTSKLNNDKHDPAVALASIDETLTRLRTDHVDLFLVHWPLAMLGDVVPTWRAMEQILAQGKARAIGVSNFNEDHLERLLAETDVVPAVNQIEVHPYFTQTRLRGFNTAHGIVTEAWAPLAQGAVLDDPAVAAIAEAHDATPAQVVIAWHLAHGMVVFPKSSNHARQAQNLAALDLELTAADVATLDGLDEGRRVGPDPATFSWVP